MKFRTKPKETEAEQFSPGKEPRPAGVIFDWISETGFSVRNETQDTEVKIRAGDRVRMDIPSDRYPITDEPPRANHDPVK